MTFTICDINTKNLMVSQLQTCCDILHSSLIFGRRINLKCRWWINTKKTYKLHQEKWFVTLYYKAVAKFREIETLQKSNIATS